MLLWTQNLRVHSSMVRAADCRSAGPWSNSGWMSWFIFMTGSDNLTNHPAQRYNIMSPIRTVITTITRKSVKMVAEPSNDTVPSRIPDTATGRLEDNSTVAKAATATAVALDTKGPCSTGNSCSTEERTRSISTVQDRSQGSACDCSQATERIRSRHRGGPNTRTTYRRVAGQAREPFIPYGPAGPRATRSTGQGSVDHRHRRLEDDGGRCRGRYSACEGEGRDLREDRRR